LIISIDPEQRRPIYVQIMDEVRRARLLGTVEPGEALPSVRQLAAELGVNPNTVKQAYQQLERDGVVETRRGQGTFLSDARPSQAERRQLLEGVARRAVLDARRHGATPAELIDAIHEVGGSNPSEER
jgi:GntR family transcriptional regulator